MTAAVPASQFAGIGKAGLRLGWQRHCFVLGLALAVVLVVFASDVGALVRLWWTNTTFGHCLFIGPVIGWLIWQRREQLFTVQPTGWLPGIALVGVGAFVWLLGDAGGVALARHLGLVLMLQGCVLSVLGPNVVLGILFPLVYAFFLIPFGEGMEGALQDVTVDITMWLLALANVPAHVNGVLITIPNGYFEVAEACSGSKFVIAMFAFATLVANVCFTRWRGRIAFVVMALAVAVVANGIRAFATIYAASLTSVQAATGFDHIVFGWIFFGVIMAAVLAIGWRWFDRDPDAAWFDPSVLQHPPALKVDPLVAAGLALVLVIAAPATARIIDGRAEILPRHIDLPTVPGWHRVALSARAPWVPSYPGADHFLIGRYASATGEMVDLALAVYGSQHEGKELVGFGIGAIHENDRWVRVRDLPPIDGGKAMLMTAPGPVSRVVATWYRVGNIVTADERRVKLETLLARLLGGRQRGVAVLMSAEALPGRPPVDVIQRFLQAAGPVDRLADQPLGQTG